MTATLFGQLPPPNESGVAMGHLHIRVRDLAAQKKFWVELMGATPIKLGGTVDVMKFPDVLVALSTGEPSGGTKGSSVNHLGFKVPDVKTFVARFKEKGGSIVTQAEVAGGRAQGDYWFNPAVKTNQAFLMAPEEIKIEISEEPGMKQPIAHHHIHFFDADVDGTKAWYVKMFGGKPGKRGPFECADVPGVNLSFSKSETPAVGTKGRSLDHIGFEVRSLEAFCKRLEGMGVKFDRPYQKMPALGIALAFFTDPWGTYIELTEGLDRL